MKVLINDIIYKVTTYQEYQKTSVIFTTRTPTEQKYNDTCAVIDDIKSYCVEIDTYSDFLGEHLGSLIDSLHNFNIKFDNLVKSCKEIDFLNKQLSSRCFKISSVKILEYKKQKI